MITNLFWILLLTFLINFCVANLFKLLKFYDYPEINKIHQVKTVLSGGISIIISLVLLKLTNQINLNDLSLIFKYSIVIFIIGFIDDKFKISASVKFLLLVLALILIYNFSSLPLITYIGDYLPNGGNFGSKISVILTLSGVLLLINSYNYSDGIDSICLV